VALWPDKAALLRVIDVEQLDTDDPLDTVLENVLAAAIDQVKSDVGDWDELLDEPDESLSQAALVAAEHLALRPEAAAAANADPRYVSLMHGKHRRFSIA